MATTARVLKSGSKTAPRNSKSGRAKFVSLDGRIRVEDWAKLPETKPHYELIEGVLKQKMPTRQMHAHAAFRLAFQLALWGDDLGWTFQTEGTGLRADTFNGFVPDVMGFAPETAPEAEDVYAPSAFLIAEVASPSTEKDDRDKKMQGYALAEVELYLLIDPKQKTFEVYRLENQKYGAPETLKDSEIWQPAELPGLSLELSKLWM